MVSIRASTVAVLVVYVLMTVCPTHARRPVWPDEYQVSWNFTVPYVENLQAGGLTYQYKAYQNYGDAKQKIIRDGVETVIIDVNNDTMYEIFPTKDHYTCWKDKVGSGSGPTLTQQQNLSKTSLSRRLLLDTSFVHWISRLIGGDSRPQDYLTFILPDLTEHRWRYQGIEEYKDTGIDAEVWEWDLTEGDMDMKYRFYMDLDGVPLELWMMGINLYTGGHKDEYVATYYDWQAGSIPDEEFDPPANITCSPAAPEASSAVDSITPQAGGRLASQVLQPLHQFMPSLHWGNAEYDSFIHRHARRHASPADYEHRLKQFSASKAFVTQWNAEAAGKKHRVAINRFADWTREEYLTHVTGRRVGAQHATLIESLKQHNVTTLSSMLPRDLIWKGTPADSPVKDQAACGSCWAFSASGAFESALYRLYGQQQLLSEQNMIDCAWEGELGNQGCYGGDQVRALMWALQNGGLATEANYPYQGVNNFCKENIGKIPLKGDIVIVKGGEEALKEALFTKGPMAVSVDAGSDAFRFYQGGIYADDSCATAAGDLNHAVLISGYGTTEDGEDYWLVKNIWSPYWGDDGFIYISRSPNDCGIATEPIYVELQP